MIILILLIILVLIIMIAIITFHLTSETYTARYGPAMVPVKLVKRFLNKQNYENKSYIKKVTICQTDEGRS